VRGRALVGVGLLAAATAVYSCSPSRRHDGAQLYATHCASCHGTQGEGLRRLIPPLAKSDYLPANYAYLPCLIRKGQRQSIVVNGIEYNQYMPGNEGLTDSEITNLLNYVQQHWGNQGDAYTMREVSGLLGACNGSDGQ